MQITLMLIALRMAYASPILVDDLSTLGLIEYIFYNYDDEHHNRDRDMDTQKIEWSLQASKYCEKFTWRSNNECGCYCG
jgi:hypothetical protein